MLRSLLYQSRNAENSSNIAVFLFVPLVGADRGLRLGQGRSATLLLLFLGVLGALGQQLAVLGLGLLGGLGAGALELIILVFTYD